MNTLKCSIAGCATEISVNEPLSEKARFICKNHERDEQLKAVGRRFSPDKDEQDKDVRFQSAQFDDELRRGAKPQGTAHIKFQAEEENYFRWCIKCSQLVDTRRHVHDDIEEKDGK